MERKTRFATPLMDRIFLVLLILVACLIALEIFGEDPAEGVPGPTTTIGIAWDANAEPDVAGYRVYVGTDATTFNLVDDVGDTTQYTIDVSGWPELTLYTAVTAYDIYGNESEYSDALALDKWPPQKPTHVRCRPVH